MEKKMTYSVALTNAIEVVTDEETKARLEDLKASLEKKASAKRKTVDNTGYYDKVISVLAEGGKSPTDMVTILGVANTQKVASIVKPLIDNGTVIKNSKGKKVTYTLAQ